MSDAATVIETPAGGAPPPRLFTGAAAREAKQLSGEEKNGALELRAFVSGGGFTFGANVRDGDAHFRKSGKARRILSQERNGEYGRMGRLAR